MSWSAEALANKNCWSTAGAVGGLLLSIGKRMIGECKCKTLTPWACAFKLEEKISRRSLQSLWGIWTGLVLLNHFKHKTLQSNEEWYLLSSAATKTLSFFFLPLRICKNETDGRTDKWTDRPTTERLWPQLFIMLLLVCEAMYVASSYVIAQLLMSLRGLHVGQSVRRGKKEKKQLNKTNWIWIVVTPEAERLLLT